MLVSGAKLVGASLYAVNLRDAQMLRTDLTRADMRRYRYYGHGYQSYYSYDKYYSD